MKVVICKARIAEQDLGEQIGRFRESRVMPDLEPKQTKTKTVFASGKSI